MTCFSFWPFHFDFSFLCEEDLTQVYEVRVASEELFDSIQGIQGINDVFRSLDPKEDPEKYRRSIKENYVAAAREFHPDKGGDEEQFKKVDELYHSIVDSLKDF